ncbi:MAG: hypothetical protein OHK0046_21710 [Anaerolineae bacterium]
MVSLAAVFVLILLLMRSTLETQGLRRTFFGEGGYIQTGLWLWPRVDGADFERLDGLNKVYRVRFEGVVWQGKPGTTTWRIIHTGGAAVRVNGETVFQAEAVTPLSRVDVPIQWDEDFLRLEIDYERDILDPTTRLDFGIYEQDALGRWRVLPSDKLFPSVPESSLAQRSAALHRLTLITLAALGIFGLLLVMPVLWRLRRDHQAWLIGGVILLAAMVRLVVMAERAAADPYFYYLTPGGDDNYTVMARQWLSGQYTLAGTFWPPAPILWFALITTLFGPHLTTIYLANIAISGLAAGAVTRAGWLAFGRRAGLFGGLVFTLYPPLIFYTASTQSVVLDAALVSFAVLFGLHALQQGTWRMAVLFGVCIGLGGLSRGTVLLLGPAFFLALVLARHPRWLPLTSLAASSAVLVLLPQILLNWQATGEFSPTPYGNGALTLYSGNNRAADGLWVGRGAAWELERLQGGDWNAALLADVRDDPLRVGELFLRKLALFFNNEEQVSNLDYGMQGLPHSALLRLLSLNGNLGMWLISLLTWAGLVLVLLHRSLASRFLFWGLLLSLLGAAVFVIAGRLRVPAFPLLAITAGVALHHLLQTLETRRLSRRVILAGLTAAMLAVTFPLIEDTLPRPRYNADAPAIPRVQTFENGLQLLGFDAIQTDHSHYVYVSLVWYTPTALDTDYTVFVEVADANGRVAGVDRPMGSLAYPDVPTSQWPAGARVREGYLMTLPEGLSGGALDVNVGVYATATGEALPLMNTEQTLVRLTGLGIRADRVLPPLTEAQTVDALFEDTLMLCAVSVPRTAQAGEMLPIRMSWEAQQTLYEDVVVFIHLLDAEGEQIVQIDQPDLAPARTTSTLIPGEQLNTTWQLQLPDDLPAGGYQVVLGAYRLPEVARLGVVDAAGNPLPEALVHLGTINVG